MSAACNSMCRIQGELILVALAARGKIGVDVERAAEDLNIDGVAGRFFSFARTGRTWRLCLSICDMTPFFAAGAKRRRSSKREAKGFLCP